jgi:cytochrome P450
MPLNLYSKILAFVKLLILFSIANTKIFFDENVVQKDADDWRRQRNIINSGFTNQALSNYYPIFLELSEKSIQTIPVDTDWEVSDFFSRFTLDVLGRTIFNHDFGRIEGKNDKYYTAYKNFFGLFSSTWILLMILFPNITRKLPVKSIQDYNEGIETLVQFIKDIIKEHREKKDNSILSKLLIAADNPELLSENELISNVWIFFIAGHETTASALIWGLNCLRLYPDIQEKLYEEIKNFIGEDRVPTEEELEKLVYLNTFINEVLRLHSPIPALNSREATEDVKYKEMIIPKGARVGIHFHSLHTNPEYWDDPEKFDPDRFLPENRKGRNHYLHIPFSAGLRQCIGNNFSLIEQRLFLTRLLQKYRIVDPINQKPFPADKFLRFGVRNDIFVRVVKR